VLVWLLPSLALAAERPVHGARVAFSLLPSHLQTLGLELVGLQGEVPATSEERGQLEPPVLAFRADAPAGFRMRLHEAALQDPGTGAIFGLQGGFALVGDTGSLALDGTRVVLPADADGRVIRIETPEGVTVAEAHDGLPSLGETGIRYRVASLALTADGAARLGRPDLAGASLGTMTVELDAPRVSAEARPLEAPDGPAGRGTFLDVKLGELYGLRSEGHIGSFPNGVSGLSAATTSCNAGDVIVPWNGPMAETHPFIGLAVFREHNGVLEQIGVNWLKHGFFALSNNQCGFGCSPSNGTYLGIGCSDTYSAGNNANRIYLGPREEVDPHLGEWEACGSYFDATPVNCLRDYFGNGHNSVDHRIEVRDADLNVAGAQYSFEGLYVVAGDENLGNSIGWRVVTPNWSGSQWNFSDVGGNGDHFLGARVGAWGNNRASAQVASDDGIAMLSVLTTDNGDGTWHYEYALYNRTSARGIRGFRVGTGGATITNVGFHDIDNDAATDWTATVTGNSVSWETDDFATNPDANSIRYQNLFNFRFDADVPPVLHQVEGTLFAPGVGETFLIDAVAPGGLATDAPVVALGTLEGPRAEPNPFRSGTQLAFSLQRQGPARISVHDITGRAVRTLLEGTAPAGVSRISWDGRDQSGTAVAAGVYFFRVETEEGLHTVKTTRLR
jgi:hypothetical protein